VRDRGGGERVRARRRRPIPRFPPDRRRPPPPLEGEAVRRRRLSGPLDPRGQGVRRRARAGTDEPPIRRVPRGGLQTDPPLRRILCVSFAGRQAGGEVPPPL